ncbi:MAG: hypothetical protein E7196_00410 [Anaerovibrio lipolyticus]|nr:hypothetical protein [Anaerovibrio lipolyticus]
MATTISVPVVPWHVSAGVISHNGRRLKHYIDLFLGYLTTILKNSQDFLQFYKRKELITQYNQDVISSLF